MAVVGGDAPPSGTVQDAGSDVNPMQGLTSDTGEKN
jgi:hypothetical protein